jgi:hypothetical protein
MTPGRKQQIKQQVAMRVAAMRNMSNEEEIEVWEFWRQKARKYEAALIAIRRGTEDRVTQLTRAEVTMIVNEALGDEQW